MYKKYEGDLYLKKLIDLDGYPVKEYLKTLLSDKTTKKNILFATDSYLNVGSGYEPGNQITETLLRKIEIQPRITKAMEEQSQRTRKKAEVFTPAWLCCKMNDHCDAEWFGRENVFNVMNGDAWTVTEEPVTFPKGKNWKGYVDSRRLEITCGEAPYVVSRYDASTGEMIDLKRRIGILDRKMRIVRENAETREEWLKWGLRAFQSVYGYEWQGDSLLIARVNLLMTFMDYYRDAWTFDPQDTLLQKTLSQVANVIAWNFWQMDGLTGTVPYGAPEEKQDEPQQMSFFDMGWMDSDPFEAGAENNERTECRIFDWRSNESLTYNSLKKG